MIRSGEPQLTAEVIVVPLAIADQPPIGALSLAMAESGRTFGATELALAAELGRRAAIAVENARLYAERSAIATTLQRSLLPPDLPEIPGFRLASLYRAAGEQNDVGGDFYDAFEVPGGWMVVVGDVAGRGAEAAALTSLSRYTFRTAGKLLGDPIAALEQLNAALRERPGLSLVSVCCVMLRLADGDASAELVLAGHPPAYHVRHGSSRPVGVFAPFLGAYERGGWEATTIRLEPGDQLVLYTDGVIDTVGEEERFGEERLARTLRDAAGAADAVRRIEQALVEFAHGSQVDDTAVIAVERLHGAGREQVLAAAAAMRLESLATRERSVPMIEPYQAVGLISTMRGIRRREEISWNLEHISHMIKAASWLSSMDLPVRLICIPEGGLQGFTDEVLDLDHETYAQECAIDIPGPETDYLGRLAQQWDAYVIAQAKARHPEFPGTVLQRRVRDRARGRDGHPQASQGRAAAPGRALGDPAQRLGSVDRALWQGARCVLSGRRHRDRADRDHDGQRGLLSRERARAGDERLRDRLPRAVPRAGRDERHVLGPEPRPGARQQHVRDRDEPRHVLPRQGLRRRRSTRSRAGRRSSITAARW